MNTKKTLFVILGFLVLAVVAAAGVFVATFDAERWKSEIARAVKERTGRELTIGNLSLSFYPNIGLRVNNAALSERDTQAPFLAVGDARVSVRLMSLLSGQVVVDDIVLEGVRARVVRHQDGSFNFADLLGGAAKNPEPAKKDSESSTESSSDVAFSIAAIRMGNGELDFVDMANKARYQISRLSLTTGALGEKAEGKLNVAARIVADQPVLDAELHLATDYLVDRSAQKIDMSRLDVRVKGQLQDFSAAESSVLVTRLNADLRAGNLAVQEMAATIRGQRGDETVDVKFELPRLELTADAAQGKDAVLTARLSGKAKQAEWRTEFSRISGNATQVGVGRVLSQLSARQGKDEFKARLEHALHIDIGKQNLAVAGLDGQVDLLHAALPAPMKLSLKGTVQAEQWGKQLATQLEGKLDDANLKLAVQGSQADPYRMRFDLEVDRFNLDRYQKKAAPPAGGKQGAQPGAAAPSLDLSILDRIDLAGKIRLGYLKAGGVSAEDLHLELKAGQGKAELAPISARLYQGQAKGKAVLQREGHRVQLQQTLSGVELAPLLRDATGSERIEGRGRVELDLETSLPSVDAALQNLAGRVALNVRDGAIKGVNLAKVLRDTKAMLGRSEGVVLASDATEKTDFSELSATAKITGGVARNDDLAMKSPFLRLTGAGVVDLRQSTIDYRVKTSVVNTTKGQGGRELGHLRSVTVPVALSGSLADPQWRIEYEAVAADLARKEVGRKLGNKLEEKLGGKLPGLGGFLRGR